MLSLRAAQVSAVYSVAANCHRKNSSMYSSAEVVRQCEAWANVSNQAIAAARPLVREQEANYGLFASGSQRLWSWGRDVNPTAYGFGHVWAVHDLYYWERDHRIATEGQLNPCFMNIRNPLDIFVGDGTSLLESTVLKWLDAALRWVPGVRDVSDCLQQPTEPRWA